MPHKDPEERRAYQREYMRRYRRQKAEERALKKSLTASPDPARINDPAMSSPSPTPSSPPPPSTPSTKSDEDLINELKGIARTALRDERVQEDKSMQVIDKVIEHGPKVLQLIGQFAASFQQTMAQHRPQQQEPQGEWIIPQRPPGYGTIEALKHQNNPEWCLQRDQYLQYQQTGKPIWVAHTQASPTTGAQPAPQMQSYTHANPRQAAYHQATQQAPPPRPPQPQEPRAPQTLAELKQLGDELDRQARGGGPPPAMEAIPTKPTDDQETTNPKVSEQESSMGESTPTHRTDGVTADSSSPSTTGDGGPTPSTPKTDVEEIVEVLKVDNANAMKFIIDWINNQEDSTLKERLRQEDPLGSYKHFLPMLPTQYKELIRNMSEEDCLSILKEHCPDKMSIVEAHKQQLRQLWRQLKESIA